MNYSLFLGISWWFSWECRTKSNLCPTDYYLKITRLAISKQQPMFW